MTISETIILVACLLPIACAGLAKSRGFGKPRRAGGYDNHDPRQWLKGLQGWQARANAAQQNSFEALPVLIAGVLIAERMACLPVADRWTRGRVPGGSRGLHRRLSRGPGRL